LTFVALPFSGIRTAQKIGTSALDQDTAFRWLEIRFRKGDEIFYCEHLDDEATETAGTTVVAVVAERQKPE
jgi:hypothetical protein